MSALKHPVIVQPLSQDAIAAWIEAARDMGHGVLEPSKELALAS